MEYLVISVIVVAALACPVLMCGPMILRRIGLMKTSGNDMSCMGMMPGHQPSRGDEIKGLVAKRDALDREIAHIEAAMDKPYADSQATSPSRE